MTTSWNSSRSGACLAILLTACASPTPQAPVFTEVEAQVIRDTISAMDTRMNAAVDALDCATGLGYVGDRQPTFVSNAWVVRTKPALQTACEGMVAPRTGATYATDTLSVHALSPESAYLVREGNYTINFKDGRAPVTQRLIMTTVWQKQGGTWKMVHLHESFKVPATAEP